MKTAISIPDPIFQQAEKTARQLNITRSELYAKAVVAFVEQHHTQGITEKLNEIYASENSALEPEFARAQTAMLNAEEW
jgi:metal-responsive CopG/Arc/MetJ family transcriptional regulator